MGDQYNMSGDFRGAIVNIRTTLNGVRQDINNFQTNDVHTQSELAQLVAQLSYALEKVPESRQEQAEAVAQTAKTLVEVATSEKPNKTLLEITGQGLKQAAQNLSDVLPTVLNIATQIVITVMKLG